MALGLVLVVLPLSGMKMLHQVIKVFPLLGVFFCRRDQRYCCVSLEGEPGPCPEAALLSLDSSSLVSASPPFPDEQLSEPALWHSGKVFEAEAYSLKMRNGGHKGLCVQEPHWALLWLKDQESGHYSVANNDHTRVLSLAPQPTLGQGRGGSGVWL